MGKRRELRRWFCRGFRILNRYRCVVYHNRRSASLLLNVWSHPVSTSSTLAQLCHGRLALSVVLDHDVWCDDCLLHYGSHMWCASLVKVLAPISSNRPISYLGVRRGKLRHLLQVRLGEFSFGLLELPSSPTLNNHGLVFGFYGCLSFSGVLFLLFPHSTNATTAIITRKCFIPTPTPPATGHRSSRQSQAACKAQARLCPYQEAHPLDAASK